MQAAGGLKKKRKRNLARVAGYRLYNEDEDYFDIRQMYSDSSDNDYIFMELGKSGHTSYSTAFGNIKSARPNSIRPTRTLPTGIEGQGFYLEKDFAKIRNREKSGISMNSGISSENMWNENGHSSALEERPVLLSKSTISRLKSILLLGILSLSFPWKWNSKTQQIDKWGRKLEVIWGVAWTLFSIQSTLMTSFQFYSFFARMSLDAEGSYRPVFMNSFSVLWYCYAVSLNILMFLYRDKMRCYVNTLLQMNRKFMELYAIDPTLGGWREGGQAILTVSIRTNMGQVFISTTLFLVMPFQPWYLYSYIYTPQNPWYWLIPGALQEFMFVGQVLAIYLLIAWITVAHALSVEFWLQEAHNHNESEGTSDELRDPHRALEIYRALQVLNATFNEAMSPLAIPIVKLINWTALIPCGYVLIRSMNQKFVDEFPGILTYPFGVVDCVTCSYGLLQISAQMCDISASFLNSWSLTKHKDLRRVLASFPTLKVKIGSLYPVSMSTTITYFKACFDYIIDAIITFK